MEHMEHMDHKDDDISAQSEHEWLNRPEDQKLVHDSVHDSFFLPRIVWNVIDKPEFQRLRDIKQTGNTCYVYLGAEHTRFIHCIAVSHLCIKFARTIQADNPDLLTDRQILLLGVAGLVHDIGHCAFSHLYDSLIVPTLDPDSDFTHEKASCEIFLLMCRKYPDLRSEFTLEERQTICKLITGKEFEHPELPGPAWNEWDETHPFYYEILSNGRLGIDVDKFDYLKRDSHYTGIHTTFDPTRLISLYYIDRVKDRSGRARYFLEFQPKAAEIIAVMWRSRSDLHRRVYQHRVVKCIDSMTAEAILHCADVTIKAGNVELPLRQAHTNMEVYCKLTDSTIRQLAQQVSAAREIFNRIDNRDLWKTIASVISNKKLKFNFSQPDITIATAHLSDCWIYYILNMGYTDIVGHDPEFYRELILSADGGAIYLRGVKDPP